MKFKHWIEAVMSPEKTTSSGGGTIDNINNDDGGDDGDEWDEGNIRKRFWNSLYEWVSTSPAANMVRFNVYSRVVQGKPQLHPQIYASDGNDYRYILKRKGGNANIHSEWTYPMDGMAWDKLVEQQRPVLAKTDLWKAFGEAGSIGTAALLFKGDVLDVVVEMCCEILPDNGGATWYRSTSPFAVNMLKVVDAKWKDKIEAWTKRAIARRINKHESLIGEMKQSNAMSGCQAMVASGNVVFRAMHFWTFTVHV